MGSLTCVQCGGMQGTPGAHLVDRGAPGHVEEEEGSNCLALGESNSSRQVQTPGHVHSPQSYSPALSCISNLLCPIDT